MLLTMEVEGRRKGRGHMPPVLPLDPPLL